MGQASKKPHLQITGHEGKEACWGGGLLDARKVVKVYLGGGADGLQEK